MSLTRDYKKTILDRAKKDPKFRVALLKELLRLALKADPALLSKALLKLEPEVKKKK